MLARYLGAMHHGEVGISITPIVAAASHEPEFAAQLDALLRRTCHLARALTGAEQAALRDDELQASFDRETALENAPLAGSGHFKVPLVIER